MEWLKNLDNFMNLIAPFFAYIICGGAILVSIIPICAIRSIKPVVVLAGVYYFLIPMSYVYYNITMAPPEAQRIFGLMIVSLS